MSPLICRVVFLPTKMTAERPFFTVHGQVLTSPYYGVAGSGLSRTQSEHRDYALEMESATMQSVAFSLEQEDSNRSRYSPSQAFCCPARYAGAVAFSTARQLQVALMSAIGRFPACNTVPAGRGRPTTCREGRDGEEHTTAPMHTTATWSSKDLSWSSVA